MSNQFQGQVVEVTWIFPNRALEYINSSNIPNRKLYVPYMSTLELKPSSGNLQPRTENQQELLGKFIYFKWTYEWSKRHFGQKKAHPSGSHRWASI